jgi:hypothetical protein
MSPIRLLRVKVRTVHQQTWSSPGVYDEKSPGRNKFFGQSFPASNPQSGSGDFSDHERSGWISRLEVLLTKIAGSDQL